MTINDKQKEKISQYLYSYLLDEEVLEYDTPWGEDGNHYAFERGEKFGEHYLATDILELFEKNNKEEVLSTLYSHLLDEEQLSYKIPGEDSVIYAFENGQEYGAHCLAERIIKMLKK